MDDRAIVERQLGRRPRAFRRVIARCPYGNPAVTEQAPFDENGAPFPTTFWLTCPHLVAAVSRLEAAGGGEPRGRAGGAGRWPRPPEQDPALAGSLERANREQRELRPELAVGIGGSSRTG